MAAVLVVAGCGDEGSENAGRVGIAWEGEPTLRASPTTGARVLIGTMKNGTSGELRIKSSAVRLVDQRRRRIKASAVFASSFVRSLYPQSGRPGATRKEFPEAEQRRIGDLAVLEPGQSVPLTVSWNEPRGSRTAKRIVTAAGSLPIPAAPTEER